MPASRTNVLIIISDQHSKHHLGCYGDSLVRTPHLDGLAERGVRFTDAYCPSPLCVPSRMSFMTSRRPTANRAWNNGHILDSAIPTWAHAMGAAGYETALVGRMHFVGPDQRHGFEKRPIGEYSAVAPGADRLGGIQLDRIHGTAGQSRRAVECSGHGRTTYQAFDDMIADAACAYLDEKAADADGRPFAAVAGFVLPHCPFFAPRDLFDYYYERVDVPQPTPEELEREPAAVRKFKESRGIAEPLTEERIRISRAAYLGLCEYFDARVGQMLSKLRETGLDRNTLVVYTSDHGEMAGEHGCWWKSNYYEGSAGVPLIASLPGTLPESTVSNDICNLMDLGPTVVEMAGADPMPATDGHSLWKTMTDGPDPNRPKETFSELVDQRIGGIPSRMVRRGPWKLYRNHDGTPPVLFNLEDDPGELVDLGADPALEGIRQELLDRLHDGWDPESISRQNVDLNRDMEALSAWGKAVQPPYADSLPIPEGAEDVVIL